MMSEGTMAATRGVVRGGRLTLPAVILLGAAACSSDARHASDQVVVDTLASGAIMVSNPRIGAWDSSEWRLTEDLRLGSVDGDGLDVFGEVRALEVDDLGRIYVLDAQAHQIRVFEADGTPVRAFGRRGSGPGELSQPAALTWGPDGDLWVLDYGNGRWTVFDTAGVHVGQEPRSISFLMMPWPGRFDDEGRLFDVAAADRIIRARPGETTPETFTLALDARETFEVRTEHGQYSAPVPFTPQPIWHLDRAGFIWYGTGDRYAIARRTLDGDTVLIVSRRHEPEGVTDADRSGALALLGWTEEVGMEIELDRIPRVKPAYTAFFADGGGYLWVVSSPIPGEAFPTWGSFDLFDSEGVFLGQVESDTPILPFIRPVIRGGYMYAIHVGEMQVMYVVRLRIDGRS